MEKLVAGEAERDGVKLVAAEGDRGKFVAAEAKKCVLNWLSLLRAGANFSSVLHVGFAAG